MKKVFGTLPSGQTAYLYTITGGGLTAEISDFGAAVVKLFVPDSAGRLSARRAECRKLFSWYFLLFWGFAAGKMGTAGKMRNFWAENMTGR